VTDRIPQHHRERIVIPVGIVAQHAWSGHREGLILIRLKRVVYSHRGSVGFDQHLRKGA
jgi:hypothetical protein